MTVDAGSAERATSSHAGRDGAVPDGWRRVPLGTVEATRTTKVDPRLRQGLPYVALEHLEQGQPRLVCWQSSDAAVSTKTAFRAGDVLFGKLRPNLRKAAPAPFDGICSTDILALYARDGLEPAFHAYMKNLQWLGKVRMAARARFREEHFDLKRCGEKVRALISEYIGADEVKRLLEPVSIFSQRFDEEVRRLTRPEAKASEMEHALRYEIKVRYEDNTVLYESLRERLEKIIAERKAARISQAEQLQQLEALVAALRDVQSHMERLGLTKASFPIYELLPQHRDAGDDRLARAAEPRAFYHAEVDESARNLAAEIESDIKELAVIDWTMKEDVQREMRRRIKRRLRNADFPAEAVEAATTQIFDVARRTIA